ncbi:putative lipid II flippase FtsW [Candidatus Poribacteria bacterium]|nr:putative lipid II flippase FtsW [Candidatus Poribacteria bacterium]
MTKYRYGRFRYSTRNRGSKKSINYAGGFDKILLITVGILVMTGIVMVYSSSNAVARESLGTSYHFFKMQIIWCILGLAAMIFTAFFDYQNYAKFARFMLIFAGFLLVMVYVPFLGITRGGGTRWIKIWRLSFQPVEIAKLVIVIYMAELLDRKADYVRNYKLVIMPSLIMLFIFSVLLYGQPDFGSILIIGFLVYTMLLVGGVRIHHMVLLSGIALLLIALAIWQEPYRLVRWTTFLDPWKDKEGAGYHIIQSLYAFGSGGVLGRGLGAGIQKLHYLPTPHTDFIFAVIGEELGFVGAFSVVMGFMIITWRGIHISLSAPERFGALLAFGITILIGFQAMLNIAVATGSLPTKGLTLPFMSFGGSSMLVSMASTGILLNISRPRNLGYAGTDSEMQGRSKAW